ESEVPVGWGALVESNDTLTLVRKPIWHDATAASRIHVLHRIAVAGNTELKSRTLARLARANCARSFLLVAASRAEIKESAPHPPECRLRSGTSPHRWQHK